MSLKTSLDFIKFTIITVVMGVTSSCHSTTLKGELKDDWYPNFRVQFLDKETGWILGPKLLLTTDAGVNWKVIKYPAAIRSGDGPEFARFFMQFVDPDWAWRFSLNTEESIKLQYTSNGGKNWSIPVKVGITGFYALVFPSREIGWVLGSQDYLDCVYFTKDAGRTWMEEKNLARLGLQYPFFLDDQCLWLAGRYGTIAYTFDGGKNWEINRNFPKEVRGIYFLDRMHGWATGDDGLLCETRDGGKSWSRLNLTVSFDTELKQHSRLLDVFFLDDQQGWVVGHNGGIYHTLDGGIHWYKSETPTTSSLSSIRFVSPLRGWAVGGDGEPLFENSPVSVILESNDGGKTWQIRQI